MEYSNTEKYQSEAFFISPPDEQQTAEKLAYSSLWLQSVFSPWTAGSQDRSACKATAVLNPTQGNLPTCIPSIAASCSHGAYHHSHISSQEGSDRDASCLVDATFPSKDDGVWVD